MRYKMRSESIYRGVSQISTPCHSIHLHYPCISVHLPSPGLSPSSLYLCTRAVAQSSAKLSGGGGGGEKRIFPPLQYHFGCSFFLFSLLCLFTLLLLWFSAKYKLCQHGFLPPPEISQVAVELPYAPDPPKGCPQQYCSVVGLIDSHVYVYGTVV